MPPRLPTPPDRYDVQDQAALRRELENAFSKVESAATGASGAPAAPADGQIVTHTNDIRLTNQRVATTTSEVSFDLSVAGQIKAVIASSLARLGIAQAWTAVQTFIDTIVNGILTVTKAGGTPIVSNRNDAAAALGIYSAQRAGSTKWLLGVDSSDKFAVMDSVGTVRATIDPATGSTVHNADSATGDSLKLSHSGAGVGPILRLARSAATARTWQARLGTNGKLEFVDETGGVLVVEIGSADALLNGILTAVMAGGTPIVSNRNDDASVNRGMYVGQRAGATKWILGTDTGDHFAILDASGTRKAWVDLSNGVLEASGGVNSDGDLTVAKTGGDISTFINGDAGRHRGVGFRTSGANRWYTSANLDAEAGSDAGSDYQILKYSDAGTATVAFKIKRSNGNTHIGGPSNAETGNPLFMIHGGTGAGGSGRTGSLQVDSANRHLNLGSWNGLRLWTNVGDEAAPTTGVLALAADTSGNLANTDGNAVPGVHISGVNPTTEAYLEGTLWCVV